MDNNNNNKGSTVAVIIFFVIFAVFFFSFCGESGSKSGRKWSDLSDVEKDNARWAYETKQYIDSRD